MFDEVLTTNQQVVWALRLGGLAQVCSPTAKRTWPTAAVTVGIASGLRAWLWARRGAWLTPRRMRFATVALLSLPVLASGVAPGGGA